MYTTRLNLIPSFVYIQRIDQVLKRFGSNIIFSNGMQDPWSRGRSVNIHPLEQTQLIIFGIIKPFLETTLGTWNMQRKPKR